MTKWISRAAALLAFCAPMFAQNIVGDWQGSINLPNNRSLRVVVKITRASDESLKAAFYSIDQQSPAIPANAVTFQGMTLKFGIPAAGATYEGKMSSDGNTIQGTFTQGGPLPLNFERATAATAWAIPEPPPPPKTMAADADPSFEVATIKPTGPDSPGFSLLVGRAGGNTVTATSATLASLITFAYGIHAKQLSGGPSWMEFDRYDLTAKPDQAGIPSVVQLRTMLQKLLKERFGLEFHREKKELSAYTINIGKGGHKMNKAEGNRGNLPGMGGRGLGNAVIANATMSDFAMFLQTAVLDRPVVDQTGLTDRFDFTLKWTPDQAQIAALAPGAPPPAPPEADAPPDFFTAVLQQAGLKVESAKAPVEVLVVDKVNKPTEN